MFEGFVLDDVDLEGQRIRVRYGGSGPAVVLLHGHPRAHTTWYAVAPRLVAAGYTVVCPDLRGYGQSGKPVTGAEHTPYSKRELAADVVRLMTSLGHERFAVAGHDRGSYVAYRTALDHPERVSKLVVMDSVPVVEALERCGAEFAAAWWHWWFFAQQEKPAERVICADPDTWYNAWTTLALWSTDDDMEQLYGDVVAVWRPWCRQVEGHGIKSTHHIAERNPEDLVRSLRASL
ncbi:MULTISPECIES: alpha/beta fold hydrolase [Kribbella]|uniref:Alpha/beta hydrolase n=1 Tax=Kribbella karoonensis TaxID=324851 RepID=A0ABN2ERY0_9ACTN